MCHTETCLCGIVLREGCTVLVQHLFCYYRMEYTYSMFQIDVTTSHRDCTGDESLLRLLIIKADPNKPIALKLQGEHLYNDSTCFYGEVIDFHRLLLVLL